ncbi:hypothetical protein [Sandarakinorhabdus oryzae]|uniref:hypothetical protein n=1 Tax=Sandarakinorhabdus oryzae TaxID=2675220 RepID=UPI0012E28096|nr:hypothetical protein [Sandarakinorhabdus oryzae]
MNTRTIQSNVLFLYPFRLKGMTSPLPPGLYRLIADQEQLSGLSFTTYRTLMAFLELPALGTGLLATSHVLIDLADLDACLRADRLAASNPNLLPGALPAAAVAPRQHA